MSWRNQLNPVGKQGLRDLHCVYYESCLDLAIANDWPGFCCQYCPRRNCSRPLGVEDIELYAPGWEEIWGGAVTLVTQDGRGPL